MATSRSWRVVSIALCPILLASRLTAQEPPKPDVVRIGAPGAAIDAPSAPALAFGPDIQTTIIPASSFVPGSNAYAYSNFFGDTITPAVNGNQRWHASLPLPSGAVVTEVDLLVTDSDGASDITAYLFGECFPVSSTGPHGAGYFWTAASSGSAGDSVIPMTGSPLLLKGRGNCSVGPSPVFDAYFYYYVGAYLETTSHSLSGAAVKWYRSVSPAPLAATFGDVPTSHPFYQFVEALVASGVTAGCGSGNYCPDNPVTRGQMAVFLAKALGLHWPD